MNNRTNRAQQIPGNARPLLLERLEYRQMLSASDVLMDSSVGSDYCEIELIAEVAWPVTAGHTASQGRLAGIDYSSFVNGSNGSPPYQPTQSILDGALSSSHSSPVVVPADPQSDSGNDQGFIDEDLAEGENPNDISAPPINNDPSPSPDNSGPPNLAPIQQAILPTGFYFDLLQNSSTSMYEQLEGNEDTKSGGFIELNQLRRTDFRSNTFIQSTSDWSDSPLGSADGLSEVELSDLILNEDLAIDDLGIDDEAETVDSAQTEARFESADDEAQFVQQYGGLIHAHHETQIPVDSQVVATEERTREEYQVVDANIGTMQAFDVILADELFIPEHEYFETSITVESSTPEDDEAIIPVEAHVPSATDAAVGSSASMFFLMGMRSTKKKSSRFHRDVHRNVKCRFDPQT